MARAIADSSRRKPRVARPGASGFLIFTQCDERAERYAAKPLRHNEASLHIPGGLH